MKRILRKIIGGGRLLLDEFIILLVEVEVILNSRLFTYVFIEDLEEFVILVYLMCGRRLLSLLDILVVGDFRDFDWVLDRVGRDNMFRRLKYFSNVFDYFWKRW